MSLADPVTWTHGEEANVPQANLRSLLPISSAENAKYAAVIDVAIFRGEGESDFGMLLSTHNRGNWFDGSELSRCMPRECDRVFGADESQEVVLDPEIFYKGLPDRANRLEVLGREVAVDATVDRAAKIVACGMMDGKVRLINFLAAADADPSAVVTGVMDAHDREIDFAIEGEAYRQRTILDMASSPEGDLLVTGSNDFTCQIHEITIAADVKFERLHVLEGHKDMVQGVTLTPDCETVVSASHDMTLRTWNVRSGRCLEVFELHGDSVRGVSIAGDGVTGISAGGKTLCVWDVQSGVEVAKFDHPNLVYSCDSILASNIVVSGCSDNRLRAFNLNQNSCVQVLIGTQFISKIILTPSHNFAIGVSQNALTFGKLDVQSAGMMIKSVRKR